MKITISTIVFSALLLIVLLGSYFLYLISSLPSTTTYISQTKPYQRKNNYQKSFQWKKYKERQFAASFQGILLDNTYCNQVQKYRNQTPFLLDNNNLPIIQNRVIFTNFPDQFLTKIILQNNYPLVLQSYTQTFLPFSRPPAYFPLNLTLFYTMTPFYHQQAQIGTNFLCKGQRYNHIPGSSYLDSKDQNILDFQQYSKNFKQNSYCFNYQSIIPKTYLLSRKQDCKQFVDLLFQSINQPSIQWIFKKGSDTNRGLDVQVVTQKFAKEFIFNITRKTCKQYSGFIAQKYISNPLLINNHKFDIRVYMLIASMDPLIILYHDGYIKMAIQQFDPVSSNSWTHITNVAKARQYFQKLNLTKDQQQEFYNNFSMKLSQFDQYAQQKEIFPQGWFSRNFRQKAKKLMYHLVKMNWLRMLAHPGVFQLFGLDFLMDADLNIWFIQLNNDPAIDTSSSFKQSWNTQIILDILQLEYTLQHTPQNFAQALSKTNFEDVKQSIEPECLQFK